MDTIDLAETAGLKQNLKKEKRRKALPIKAVIKCAALEERGQTWWGSLQAPPDLPGHIYIVKAQLCSVWYVWYIQVTLDVREEFNSKFVNVGISQ